MEQQQTKIKAIALLPTCLKQHSTIFSETALIAAQNATNQLLTTNQYDRLAQGRTPEEMALCLLQANEVWLDKNNPQNSKLLNLQVATVVQALNSNTPTLAQLRVFNPNGQLLCKSILVVLVSECASLINVGKGMTDAQVVFTANFIMTEYYMLNLAEIRLVLHGGAAGKYGQLYDRLDTTIIGEWFAQYQTERAGAVEQIQEKRKAKRLEEEKKQVVLTPAQKMEKAQAAHFFETLVQNCLNYLQAAQNRVNAAELVTAEYKKLNLNPSIEIGSQLLELYIWAIQQRLKQPLANSYELPMRANTDGNLQHVGEHFDITKRYIIEKINALEKAAELVAAVVQHFDNLCKTLQETSTTIIDKDAWLWFAEKRLLSALKYRKPNTIESFLKVLHQCVF